jgi:hypothetical protein
MQKIPHMLIHFETKAWCKKNLFLLFFTFAASLGFSQQNGNATAKIYQSLSSTEISKYNNFKFGNEVALMLEKDSKHLFFLIDMSKLATDFERAHFINSVYKANYLLQINHGLSTDKAWILFPIAKGEKKSMEAILELYENTKAKSKDMSIEEQKEWLKSKLR